MTELIPKHAVTWEGVGSALTFLILADRGDYILPWTAYLVEQSHRQRKLQREYEEYCKGKG